MGRYVLTYDVLSNDRLERENRRFACTPFEGDFREVLIDFLCEKEQVTAVDWKNSTTVEISTNESMINELFDDLLGLGYCIDIYIAKVAQNAEGRYIRRQEIKQQTSVRSFRDLKNERCERLR